MNKTSCKVVFMSVILLPGLYFLHPILLLRLDRITEVPLKHLPIDELLTPNEASHYLHGAIKPKTLANWRSSRNKSGPPWYTIGREIRYAKSDLDQYLSKSKVIPGV